MSTFIINIIEPFFISFNTPIFSKLLIGNFKSNINFKTLIINSYYQGITKLSIYF